MTALRAICILSLLSIFTLAMPASALAKNIRIPVFYVTDRQPRGSDYGPRRLPENGTVSGLHSGVIEVNLPVADDYQSTDWQRNGLKFTDCSKHDHSVTKTFKGESTTDLNGEFDATFKEFLSKGAQKEAFVFIHGYNNSFEVAAENAAQLSFHTGCPVILYSWPSVSKLYRYSVDECNNEWSQEHFNEFLEHLLELKVSQAIKLNIVAHSMGNRLFVRAVPIMKGKGLFSDIYLVNPDFDAQTFVHYLSRYIPKTGFVSGVRAQLLVSRKDKALSVAEGLFGGYTRLGQGADFTLSALTRPDLFSKVWSDHSDGGKDSDQSKISSMRAESIERVIRVVDVTALDYGWLGHKVPHDYIASMHFKDSAPQGFELKRDKSMGCNKVSKFFAKMCGQKIAPPVGSYLIVTRSNDAKDNAAKDISQLPATKQ